MKEKLDEIYKNKNFLFSCCSFKLKRNLRSSILRFFEHLHEQLNELERQKLEEFRFIFRNMNTVDIADKSKELLIKGDKFWERIEHMHAEFENRNFGEILRNTPEIESKMEQMEKMQSEINGLIKDYEK